MDHYLLQHVDRIGDLSKELQWFKRTDLMKSACIGGKGKDEYGKGQDAQDIADILVQTIPGDRDSRIGNDIFRKEFPAPFIRVYPLEKYAQTKPGNPSEISIADGNIHLMFQE